MLKLCKLVKINLLSYFNFYKIKNAKTGVQKSKELGKIIFLFLFVLFFAWYIYAFARMTMNGLAMLHIEYVIIGEFFALASLFSLFQTIFKVDSILFSNKDYDMLAALPIKKTTIVASKMLHLYFSNLLFSLIIMLPVLLVYMKYVTVSSSFILLYICSIFVLPFIPTLVAIIIGSFISFIVSRFKLKKFLQFLLMFIILGGAFYFTYSNVGGGELEIANFGNTLVETFNQYYPLTKTYMLMLLEKDMFSTLLFIGLPIILYFLSTLVISLFYTNVVNMLSVHETKRKYKLKNRKEGSILYALFRKEFFRYITSANYVFNTIVGVILMLVGSVLLLFISPSGLEDIIGIAGFAEMLAVKAPLVLGVVLMMSSTTSSSISLEGKNFWILKSLPVKPQHVFFSKILVNVLVVGIPSMLCACLISYILHFSFIELLVMLASVMAYSIFIALFGLIMNLHFPLLEWKNEIKVIKQSLSTFLTIIIGLILGILPLTANLPINGELFTLLCVGSVFIIDLFLLFYLNTMGVKLFRKIQV